MLVRNSLLFVSQDLFRDGVSLGDPVVVTNVKTND